MIGGLLRVLIVALVLLVGAMVWVNRVDQAPLQTEAATVLPQALALPAFELGERHGRPFSKADLEGRFSLLFFGFTHCPDVCPLSLQVLATARAALEERGVETPQVVFVSVDPQRDTPERIDAYLDNFDPDFLGVTGGRAALEPLRAALGVTVLTHEMPGQAAYDVTHNATVYVIGPKAEWIALFSEAGQAATLNADFLRIRRHYLATQASPASS